MEDELVTTAQSLILQHPWAVVAIVVIAIVLVRGLMRRRHVAPPQPYRGAPRTGEDVPDSAPIVRRARRQMIMALIVLVVVAILVIMQNLR